MWLQWLDDASLPIYELDEDFWIPPLPGPWAPPLGVWLPWLADTEPSSLLAGQPDEDFWSPPPPQPWATSMVAWLTWLGELDPAGLVPPSPGTGSPSGGFSPMLLGIRTLPALRYWWPSDEEPAGLVAFVSPDEDFWVPPGPQLWGASPVAWLQWLAELDPWLPPPAPIIDDDPDYQGWTLPPILGGPALFCVSRWLEDDLQGAVQFAIVDEDLWVYWGPPSEEDLEVPLWEPDDGVASELLSVDEDYWPWPAAVLRNPPPPFFGDTDDPTFAVLSQPDEDLWPYWTRPVSAPLIWPVYWLLEVEGFLANLPPDEDFWVNVVLPDLGLTNRQAIRAWQADIQEPSGLVVAQPDEDYWINPVFPTYPTSIFMALRLALGDWWPDALGFPIPPPTKHLKRTPLWDRRLKMLGIKWST